MPCVWIYLLILISSTKIQIYQMCFLPVFFSTFIDIIYTGNLLKHQMIMTIKIMDFIRTMWGEWDTADKKKTIYFLDRTTPWSITISPPSLPSTVVYVVVLRKKRQISQKKTAVILSTAASHSSLDNSPPLPHNLLRSPFSPPQPALPGQAAPSPSSPPPALPGQAALPFVTSVAAP